MNIHICIEIKSTRTESTIKPILTDRVSEIDVGTLAYTDSEDQSDSSDTVLDRDKIPKKSTRNVKVTEIKDIQSLQ